MSDRENEVQCLSGRLIRALDGARCQNMHRSLQEPSRFVGSESAGRLLFFSRQLGGQGDDPDSFSVSPDRADAR
jgi:hypothetical protein